MREFFKKYRWWFEFLYLLTISIMLVVIGSFLHSQPKETVEKPCYDEFHNVIQNTTCTEEVPKTDSVSMSTLIELGPAFIIVGAVAFWALILGGLAILIFEVVNRWP